jgi:hypothetical protein
MGLNRLGLLMHRANRELPADVRELTALEFTSHASLSQVFLERFGHLLRRYS